MILFTLIISCGPKKEKKKEKFGVGLMALKGGREEPSLLSESFTSYQRKQL